MRIVVYQGTKLTRYRCDVCGQVELHSAEETHTCSNCECLMVKDVQEKPDNPVKSDQENVQQKPKRKGGRPRKNQPLEKTGTCSDCKNALRNTTGYTCEIDWQSHNGTDSCPNHKDGVPVD